METTPSRPARCPNCQRHMLTKGPLCLFCGAKLILSHETPPEEQKTPHQTDPEQQPPTPPELERQAVPVYTVIPVLSAVEEPDVLTVLPAAEEPDVLTVLPADPEPRTADPSEVSVTGLALPGPGFWAAVGWSLLTLLSPILAGCYLGVALNLQLTAQDHSPARSLFLVSSLVVSSAVMLAVVGLSLRSQARRALALRKIGGLHVLLVLLLVLPTVVLTDEIANRAVQGLDAVFGPQEHVPHAAAGLVPTGAYIRLFDEMFEELAKLPWPLALLLGCLLPGVVEEVFFRGFIGRGLVARYGAVLGVFLTSVLFALMHIDPVQIAYTMALGVVLHFVFLTTKSLLGPIMLHTLYNALGISRAKLDVEGSLTLAGPSGELVIPLPLVIASLAAVIGLCWLLYRTRVSWIRADGHAWAPGFVTAEMPPFRPAVPRRRALRLGPAFLATGAYVAFGIFFAQAMTGWLSQSAVLSHVRRAEELVEKGWYDQAIAVCNEAIRLDSQVAGVYLVRGEACRLKGMYPQSLADCNMVIQLDPANAHAYANRGETYRLQNDHNRALADCNRALQLDRQLAWAYSIRGAVHDDRKEYARAVADWDEALRLEPNHAWTNTRLAWILATCPDGRHRQGQRAITIARRACELTEWKDADALAALAAAHAECGEFRDAIRWQEKAVSLTPGQGRGHPLALLAMYRAGRPYREER